MAIISIDRLQIGMVLDSEVCDRTGRVLLKSGCELQEWHIGKLSSAGVEEVDIAGEVSSDDQNDQKITPELMQQSIDALATAFTLVDQNWDVMKELHRVAVLRDVHKKMEGDC